MNIETAKELKAFHIGYESWERLQRRYYMFPDSNENDYDDLKKYEKQAEEWVSNGIPPEEMAQILRNIPTLGLGKDFDVIRKRLKSTLVNGAFDKKVIKLINLVKSIK